MLMLTPIRKTGRKKVTPGVRVPACQNPAGRDRNPALFHTKEKSQQHRSFA
jgi:hypothetical protein